MYFNRSILTNMGRALLAEAITEEYAVMFTTLKTSSHEYGADFDIATLENLEDIKQTVNLTNKEIVDISHIKLNVELNNTGLTDGYELKCYGIYACKVEDPSTEYLIMVATGETPEIVPSQSQGVWELLLENTVEVANSDYITIEVNPLAMADKEWVQDNFWAKKSVSLRTDLPIPSAEYMNVDDIWYIEAENVRVVVKENDGGYEWVELGAGGESGGTIGIQVGLLTNDDSFPTTRLDGTALKNGDYVLISNESEFPFEIDDIEFVSSRDSAYYFEGEWNKRDGVIVDSDELELTDGATESPSGTAENQKEANIEFTNASKKILADIVVATEAELPTPTSANIIALITGTKAYKRSMASSGSYVWVDYIDISKMVQYCTGTDYGETTTTHTGVKYIWYGDTDPGESVRAQHMNTMFNLPEGGA